MSERPLLEVRGLRIGFPLYGGILRREVGVVRAVDGIDLELAQGRVLGLVGESGSGKTTVGRAICNLLRPMSSDVHLEGEIYLNTDLPRRNLNGLGRRAMLPYRAQIQMIFQDPFSSLNPRMTVQQVVEGPLRVHTRMAAGERRRAVAELLERVGLQPHYAGRYPHEFSGGQRQRIGIARALSTRPKLIIADEPVSALDVSVQAQVINLMQELARDFGLTYLFIAHDLGIVYHVSDTIAVMYLGDIVEEGPAEAVYATPRHPYTRALLSAVPQPEPPTPERRRADRIRLQGDIPTPLAKPSGCGFRTRCPIARPACAETRPTLLAVDVTPGQRFACPYSDGFDEALAL